VRSRADVEASAQQIITQVETRYPGRTPIFLIGHSLGGLIAREICRHLLVSGPDSLLSRISAAITVGTPLEGARYGNRLLRLSGFFPLRFIK
jgi:triacylglycerol esterase/lipase EstA (alpha/beta hydrolase family)